VITLINGPINSGKTTIGRLLAARLPHTAHVEVDALRAFIASVPLDEAIPINLENSVAVATVFARRGFNVVITYPIGDDDYAYLINHPWRSRSVTAADGDSPIGNGNASGTTMLSACMRRPSAFGSIRAI
jgi:hypothetical protein